MTFERVLVGVDGSANGTSAVEWAADLAALTGAEVVAVHALGLLQRLGDGTPVPVQPHRKEIMRQFEEVWCKPLDRSDVRCRRVIRDGDPVSVLLAVAEEERADLVVVGSRGVGDHPEQLLGSTSTQVAQRASRPVVVVPAASAASRRPWTT